MNLTDTQKQQVATWINDGLKLADIQKRIEAEFGLRFTYMEVKLLMGDLALTPKDPEPAKPESPSDSPVSTKAPAKEPGRARGKPGAGEQAAPLPAGPGRVSLSVDQLARPGALVSGRVTFSDGKGASWYVDQMGRLGLAPTEKGYRPPAADMQEFQVALEQELARLGL